jgi:uncharacterized OsmC-like protein
MSNQTLTKKETPLAQPGNVNGINVETLSGTVSAIDGDPELGAAHFRVTNKWLNGNQNQSTVNGFYGAKQEIAHKQPYNLLADEPPILAGSDDAPNPVEHMLHALASCVTTSLVAHAAVKGIHLDEVESEVEGDIDLRGYLGIDKDVPKGYTDIRVNFKVKADGISPERLKRLSMYSPVFNTITNGANVDIQVATV